MAGERGRDWWSVVIGLVIVATATAALWAWLHGPFPSGAFVGLGPIWLLAASAAAVLLLVLLTRLSRRRRL